MSNFVFLFAIKFLKDIRGLDLVTLRSKVSPNLEKSKIKKEEIDL